MAGMIYVIAGLGSDCQDLSSVEKYSPSSNTWSTVASLPAGRSHTTAITVGSDIFVLGGTLFEGVSASVLKYDSVQDSWSEVAPMPEGRFFHVACAIGADIYVIGGFSVTHDARGQFSVFKYESKANNWSTLAPGPMPVTLECSSASVMDGLIYIVGVGDNGHGVLRFDPASGAWSNLSPTLQNRTYGNAFVLGGCLYAAGGYDSDSSVERYDIALNTWTAHADMLEERTQFGVVTIGSAGPAGEQDLFDSLIAKASKRRQ
jgi:N-acetylneuraminic acid mutarotase